MKLFRKQTHLMGNRFVLGLVGEEELKAMQAIELAIQEIQRIEAVFSTYQASSMVSEINRNAGIKPVEVSAEVFGLIQRSQKIAELTDGAFDLSYGSIDTNLWNFNTEMKQLPSPEVAKKSIGLINYRHINLDVSTQTVFLKEKGMRIGFGGIGKGYAADCAKKVLLDVGFENGIVNASGDMCTWGVDEKGDTWKVGVANPNERNHLIAQLELKNQAVATSGNYEKFVWIDGKKYSHTIHPKTGYPIQGVKSVTVIAPFAELADALTTPIAVMGTDVALDLINQMQGIACVIIDDDNRLFCSKNMNTKVLESYKSELHEV